MQHVSIKIFAAGGDSPRLADAIPAFHRWIQKRDLPELLIDVADYSHVPAGPGVVLIGHEANYSLDNARNRPGLLYSRKVADGSLKQAYDAALAASVRLEAEPEFQGKLHFNSRQIEITLNDRLLYPNTEAGWNSVEPELRAFLDGLYGAGAYSLARPADARERLGVTVTANAALAH
ncbi:MAG: hypothetical protein P4K98_03405 [Bryobacteraceae bacterium]|nr:hypothetical protein [Bryobacteraceae bacterium]